MNRRQKRGSNCERNRRVLVENRVGENEDKQAGISDDSLHSTRFSMDGIGAFQVPFFGPPGRLIIEIRTSF